MRNYLKRFALAVAIVFTVAACGPKAFVTSGEILAATGSTFVQVGKSMNQMCAPTAELKMDPKTCEAWKSFVPDFQEAYAQADLLWNEIAACELSESRLLTGKDCGSQEEVINTVMKVKTTLSNFALKILAKGGL